MTRILIPYLLAALLGGGAVWGWLDTRAALATARADLSEAQRELRVQSELAAQRAAARDVARAEGERMRTSAEAYDTMRDWIQRRDDDAPIPDLLRDALDRMYARPPR